MPYITSEDRAKFNTYLNSIVNQIEKQGDLTYCIYYLMVKWARSKPKQGYHDYSPSNAACQDAHDEFYRKEIVPREKDAIKRNGDI